MGNKHSGQNEHSLLIEKEDYNAKVRTEVKNASFAYFLCLFAVSQVQTECICCLKSHVFESLASFDQQAKYYPSSNQFRDPPTYTHQPSMQQRCLLV